MRDETTWGEERGKRDEGPGGQGIIPSGSPKLVVFPSLLKYCCPHAGASDQNCFLASVSPKARAHVEEPLGPGDSGYSRPRPITQTRLNHGKSSTMDPRDARIEGGPAGAQTLEPWRHSLAAFLLRLWGCWYSRLQGEDLGKDMGL